MTEPVGTISFDTEPDKKVSFTDTTTPLPPTDPVANQRAIKADYGLGKRSPGATDLYTGIAAGNEYSLRMSSAVDESVDFMQRRNQLISDLARERGADFSPEQLGVLHDMTKADFATNPQDVFERKFAEQYHTDALKVNEGNTQGPIQKGLRENPEETLRLADVSQHPTMIREYAKTLAEDLDNQWNHTGWGSALLQYGGQFLPLLSAARLHNVLGQPNSIKNLLPGDNLGQGIGYLLQQDYPKGRVLLKAAVDQLNQTSTLDALTLVQAVIKYTSLDSLVNNVVGATDIAGLGSLAGKGLLKVGSGLGSVADRVSLARAATQRALKPTTVADGAEAAVKEMQAEAGVIPATPPKTYFIPETAAKRLESIETGGEGAITGFKTSKGSTYQLDGGSQTIRNRVPHPGDTEETLSRSGPQPRSAKTYYVDAEALDAVKVPSGSQKRIVEFKDGDIGISVKQPDGQWSIPFGSTKLKVEDLPRVGAAPVEVWKKNIGGTPVYNDVHFGNPITSVERSTSEPRFLTDVKNNVSVVPGKPGEGMVPVVIHPDGTIRFGQTMPGDIHHIPREVARGMKPVQKFGRAPEYKADFTKDGEPVFYTDRKNKVFSMAVPEGSGREGTVPVSVSRKTGAVQFLQTGVMKDVQKAVADTTKALASPELKVADTLSEIGDVDKAATITAVKRITQSSAEDLLSALPSGMNPKNFFGKGTALTNAWAQKMITQFTNDTQKIFDVLGKLDVSRLTEEATTVGIKEAQDVLKGRYGGRINDGWMNWLHIPPELNPNKANLDTIIGRFGDLNSRAFESRGAAELYRREIYKLTEDEGKVVQQGNSYYIQVQKFLDETSDAVQRANITPKNTTPISMMNMALNRLRTSEDLLSDFQRNNRHVATHAPQILNKLLREQIDSTASRLSKQERQNVESILRINRDELNPALGPNKRGNFYRTDSDFEQAYMSKFSALPTPEQTAHYFNYTRVSDADYMLRNLAMYRDKGRLGLEQFRFSFLDSEAKAAQIPWIEGKELQAFPWSGQNAGILIHDSQGETRLLYKHGGDGVFNTTTRDTVDKLIKERGFKIIQMFNPTKRELSDVDFLKGKVSEQVHFIVTDTSERKGLNFQQLDYRPGGHSIYMDDWYVKQPQVQVGQAGRMHYYGDNAVMNFSTEAEAIKYAARLDTARVMLKNGDKNLDAYLAANVPYSVDDFKKMFYKGHLDLEAPIVHARSGASTFQTVVGLKKEYEGMVDATKSEYNLAGSIDSAFTADRNLVLDTVQEKNGFMAIAPGRQLDPYDAINKGLGQAVRNLWLNDYKIQAVQSWLQEFGEVMKPDFKALSNNPMYFLFNPQWDNAFADKAKLAAAKASQRSIVNFVGVQSELDSQLTFVQNKMASAIYEKGGQEAAQFYADHLLPGITDPAKYVRAVASHLKLGNFNPIQMFVQAQSLANVIGIAGPTHGVPGAAAAFLMRRLAHTEDAGIIDHFAGMATKLGWAKDDFNEMYSAFRKTGLYEVAGEAAMRDDGFNPKLFRSKLGIFLDKGMFFFNEGERAVRLTAFATAYREWKVANEGVALGNREIGDIMSRSDTLSGSMTRASAAAWQTGLMSIPTQFMTYNARIAEQFFSKRLTGTEKAKLLATYATLYGIPSTAAAVVGVWPFYDDVREAAMKRNIDMSPSYMKAMSEGIPSMMFSAITGKDYNWSQRYAPGGTSVFRDLLKGEKTFLETIGGPSASIIHDIWGTTQPAAKSITQLLHGQSDDFPTRHEDWLALVNNSSTAALATRIYTAVKYGKYISKNNVQVGEMDNMDAVMSILGVTPQHLVDTYIKTKAEKEDKAAKKEWEDAAIKQFSQGMSALKRGDEQGFRDYMARFNTYMDPVNSDFTADDRMRIEERVGEYKGDLEDKVNEDFWRNSPLSQRDSRLKALQNFLINKDK